MKRLIIICLLTVTVMVTAFSQTTGVQSQIISTFAGTGAKDSGGDGGQAINAQLNSPSGLAFDNNGNLYVADKLNQRIRMITPDGIIKSINVDLRSPYDVAIDDKNILYIVDPGYERLSKVDSSGIISTIEEELGSPRGVTVDKYGNIYIAGHGHHIIKQISSSGIITTIAGTEQKGYNGENILANNAQLNSPSGITVDNNGNLYFADSDNNRVRKIDTSGIITTIAGTGSPGYNGDMILAKESALNWPTDVVLDKMGNIYIADLGNHRVRKIDIFGIISTIAGGIQGYSGDQQDAINARLSYPGALAFDSEGNLYISDSGNNVIRRISNVGLDQLIPTPTVTPTVTPTPTKLPTPDNRITFDSNTLTSNQLNADAPQGFTMGKVSFINIPTGNNTDGKGMEIKLAPGQGVWISSQRTAEAPSLAKVSGVFKASSKNVYIALVALNSPVDGQLAYTNFTGEEVPIEDYRQVNLFYEPPSRQVQVAVQVVNSPQSSLSATVWVDNLNVEAAEPEVTDNTVSLEVDGSFNEKGLEKLIVNLNDTDGAITPFFESLTDIAIRLAIEPSQLAANLGTTVTGVADQFPLRLMGQVNVSRELPTDAGTLAFIMTNGFQNIGLFRFVKDIPTTQDANQEYLLLGGDFLINNPNVPIYVVIQNAGPNIHSSVVVDDLMVVKK